MSYSSFLSLYLTPVLYFLAGIVQEATKQMAVGVPIHPYTRLHCEAVECHREKCSSCNITKDR